MIDKEQIVSFLRINDISSSASHSDIREALYGAGWSDDDVEIAILKLQDSEDPYKHDFDDPSNLFHTNSPISQKTLTSLLGVSVSISRARLRAENIKNTSTDTVSVGFVFIIISSSVVLGLLVTLSIMYMYNLGPFYSPVENYIF